MNGDQLRALRAASGLTALALAATIAAAAPPEAYPFGWATVVNNGDYMPTRTCEPTVPNPTTPPCRKFNSYNQPSVNANQVVVIRARSRGGQGGGQPVHGIYTRDMAAGTPVIRVFDRQTQVPQPNNLDTTFVEPPSFPRIDMFSNTIATRGNHQPVWKIAEVLEPIGTTGIYTNPFGPLVTGASKTGVYYRDLVGTPIPLDGTPLEPAGGTNPVVLIANNTATLIPGTSTVLGSTAPPRAADGQAVFAGVDNEENPTLGGIYLDRLNRAEPPLAALVSIGDQVPGENTRARFNRLGEGVSFGGRFVAYWGAWGTQTKTLILQCRTEGNADRIAFCNHQQPNDFATTAPVNQGIFVHDIQTHQTRARAKAPADFDDFVSWNFSGLSPIVSVVKTGMDGTLIDPEAVDDTGATVPVTEIGIERDGFRASWLAINVTMGSEETGWAGIYLNDISAR